MSALEPHFSVVIATRNRPALFRRGLASVLDQTDNEFEIIVVNDGSDEEHQKEYQRISMSAPSKVRMVSLDPRPIGHGPSYAINTGAALARGGFLTFLDDDDEWTDSDHLARARRRLIEAGEAADLYFGSQIAVGAKLSEPRKLWLAALEPYLEARSRQKATDGSYAVAVDDLMNAGGFCHLNNLVVRRDLFKSVGGMDESIRWEGDRDLFLRLIEQARVMVYSPIVVSRHHVPDETKSHNETTIHSDVQRLLWQLRVLDKACSLSKNPVIQKHARSHRTWTLKKLALTLSSQGNSASALHYALSALALAPSPSWILETIRIAATRGSFGGR